MAMSVQRSSRHDPHASGPVQPSLQVSTLGAQELATTEDVVMPAIGIKQLRNGLRRYLAAVRAGTTATDHGHPIAVTVPVDASIVLGRLIADGVVRPAAQPLRSRPRPVRATGPVSELLKDERG
jgi:antitoxin (DNA-binding transcriptional repressor) of toxin-antitoxin stability system